MSLVLVSLVNGKYTAKFENEFFEMSEKRLQEFLKMFIELQKFDERRETPKK